MSRLILVLNCGSSSIKFAIFDTEKLAASRTPLWNGRIERIGHPDARITTADGQSETLTLDSRCPYRASLDIIQSRIAQRNLDRDIVAVAHRVVHGGTRYSEPIVVTPAVLADLKSIIPLAPLHQPFSLDAMESLLASHAGLPQIACFDTAFHHTMPPVEQWLPLPYATREHGLRRYGFHGLSYEYISVALAERYAQIAHRPTIVAHLGNGASLCGMHELRSVATTMGFSALDGLMMGTRSGAVDPGALLFLMQIEKLSIDQLARMLYHESGLLGVSGISSDPRDLLKQEAGSGRARDAILLYVQRLVREIGSMTAALGGLDLLVFTAGIGEHNAEIRARVCSRLSYFGVKIDDDANRAGSEIISDDSSRVKVLVIATNEEWIAARHCVRLLAARRR